MLMTTWVAVLIPVDEDVVEFDVYLKTSQFAQNSLRKGFMFDIPPK